MGFPLLPLSSWETHLARLLPLLRLPENHQPPSLDFPRRPHPHCLSHSPHFVLVSGPPQPIFHRPWLNLKILTLVSPSTLRQSLHDLPRWLSSLLLLHASRSPIFSWQSSRVPPHATSRFQLPQSIAAMSVPSFRTPLLKLSFYSLRPGPFCPLLLFSSALPLPSVASLLDFSFPHASWPS